MKIVATAAALMTLAQSAVAWEFTPGTPCLLSYERDGLAVELTHDPTGPLYSISITQEVPFASAPFFAMQFNGPAPLVISTDRHQLTNANRTVTVIDQGFGNVLNGLQFNLTATAVLGATEITVPLDGAAEPVAAFRACDVLPSA